MPTDGTSERVAGEVVAQETESVVESVEATLLGTGTSTGVPVLNCDCRVCTSDDPRDDRLRSSCHVRVTTRDAHGATGTIRLQIDTGPDFRLQARRHEIDRVDAALFTHAHFDHVVGLDDLRPFFFFGQDTPMPCFVQEHTADVFRRMFPHIFVHDEYPAAAKLELSQIVPGDAFYAGSRYDPEAPPVRIEPVGLMHGQLPTCGFLVGRFAYLTDASAVPEASFRQLDGRVDTLVIDALHRRDHPTHFSIDEAVEAARRIGARETYFTHLTHSVRHAEEDPRLPEGVHLAYDGLKLTAEGGPVNEED